MTESAKSYFFKILRAARHYNASDIHLIAGIPPSLRVGGEIVVSSNMEPLPGESLNQLAKALLTEEHFARLEKERELSVSYHFGEYGRVRLSMYHRMATVEMAIRMCNLEIRPAAELMLPEIVEQLAQRPSGLIIITGATGTGKTTTLNYLIDVINSSRRDRIITIEDPVEFEHTNKRSIVTQIEVGTDTRDFVHFIKHVLRLDPDVIAIGEMRDLETMETALTAAETGHLVITTLHTPSAVTTVERIVSSFEGPRQPQVLVQLSSTLQGVIAQRLIPAVERKRLVLATEVLVATEAVRHMIREGRLHQLANPVATSRSAGMHSMEFSLADLYQKGQITYDQALVNANDPKALKSLLDG